MTTYRVLRVHMTEYAWYEDADSKEEALAAIADRDDGFGRGGVVIQRWWDLDGDFVEEVAE